MAEEKMKCGRPRRTLIQNELDALNAGRRELIEALRDPKAFIARQQVHALKDDTEYRENFEQPIQPFFEGKPVDPSWKMAFVAARILHTLERGTPYQQSLCGNGIQLLRKTKPASLIDPKSKLKNTDFLARLIEKCAPGWDWRQQVGDHRARDIRLAEALAEIRRQGKAMVNRYATPDSPDGGCLNDLVRRLSRAYPVTWPTLRELKLGTAMPERVLTRLINELRPKRDEIIKARDPLKRHGPPSNRYGPRLVLGLLKEFLRRLPTFVIDDEAEQHLRSIAVRGIRSLGQKLSRARSRV